MGAKRVTSRCQLCSVDVGEMIKNGPQMFFSSARCERNAILWIVFPRPTASERLESKREREKEREKTYSHRPGCR